MDYESMVKFYDTPIHGNEAEKFSQLIEVFDEAFSYDTGWCPYNIRSFNSTISSLNVQLMELLRLVMQQENFEDLARKSDEKAEAMRRAKPMRIIKIGDN